MKEIPCIKLIFTLFVLICITHTVNADLALEDSVRYDRLSSPYAYNPQENAVSIGMDGTGDIYVGGKITTNNLHGFFHFVKYSPDLSSIIKEDSLSLSKPVGPTWLNAMYVDNAGVVYLTGNSFNPGGGYYHALTGKFDSYSNLIWEHWYDYDVDSGNFNRERFGEDLTYDNNGNVYVIISANNTFWWTVIVKYASDSTNPQIVWEDINSRNGWHYKGKSITTDGSNYIYCGYDVNMSGLKSAFIKRYDLDGNYQSPAGLAEGTLHPQYVKDVIFVPGSSPSNDRVILITTDYITCYSTSLSIIWYSNVQFEKGIVLGADTIAVVGTDGVAVYDISGSAENVLWSCSESNNYIDIAVAPDNNVVAVGKITNADDDYVITYFPAAPYITGIPFDCSKADTFTYDGGNGDDEAIGVVVTDDNVIYVTGTSRGQLNDDYLTLKIKYTPPPLICLTDSCLDFCAGDVDGSGDVNVIDLTYLVAYLFQGGPSPQPYQSGNMNYSITPNCSVDVTDLTYLVSYLFIGGPTPTCPACP